MKADHTQNLLRDIDLYSHISLIIKLKRRISCFDPRMVSFDWTANGFHQLCPFSDLLTYVSTSRLVQG